MRTLTSFIVPECRWLLWKLTSAVMEFDSGVIESGWVFNYLQTNSNGNENDLALCLSDAVQTLDLKKKQKKKKKHPTTTTTTKTHERALFYNHTPDFSYSR